MHELRKNSRRAKGALDLNLSGQGSGGAVVGLPHFCHLLARYVASGQAPWGSALAGAAPSTP
jgi:hypothetical protein